MEGQGLSEVLARAPEVSVTGPYVERFYQSELHDGFDSHRNSIVIAHRRAGKTVSMVAQLIRDVFACKLKRPQVAYIAPTMKQARAIAFDYFRDFLADVPGCQFREHELRIELPGSRRIMFASGETPDRLRGLYLDAACVDEMADCPESLITTCIRPCLADRAGKLYLIGTVKGRNYFWRTYERACTDPGWFTANLLPDYTKALPLEELDLLRAEMSEEEYASEMLNDPSAAVRGAYYGKAMQRLEPTNQISVPWDQSLGITLSFDLGIANSTAIWVSQILRGGEIHLIDYLEYQNTSFATILQELRAKPWEIIKWIGPHDLQVREYSTGVTRYDTARDLGVVFEIAPKLPVIEGIEAVLRVLDRCYFDKEACRTGIDCLALYRSEYDEKRRVMSRNPVHDYTSDAADSFRYLITGTRGGKVDLFPSQGRIDYGNH